MIGGACAGTVACPSLTRVCTLARGRYANLCADMVRAALKEPLKGKSKAREAIYFRQSLWKDGVPQKQGEPCKQQCSRAACTQREGLIAGKEHPRSMLPCISF